MTIRPGIEVESLDHLVLTVRDIARTCAFYETALGIAIILGPVARAGAQAELRSLYVYDPDENLVEISNLVG